LVEASILSLATTATSTTRCRAVLEFLCFTVTCLRIVFHDLAFEDPGFDPDDTVRCHGFVVSVIDVGAQSVQRHTTFAVPFGPCDFSAAQTTSADPLELKMKNDGTVDFEQTMKDTTPANRSKMKGVLQKNMALLEELGC